MPMWSTYNDEKEWAETHRSRCCGGTGFRVVEQGDSYVVTRNCETCNPLGGLAVTTEARSSGTIRFGDRHKGKA